MVANTATTAAMSSPITRVRPRRRLGCGAGGTGGLCGIWMVVIRTCWRVLVTRPGGRTSVPTTGGYTGIASAYHYFDVDGLDAGFLLPWKRWGNWTCFSGGGRHRRRRRTRFRHSVSQSGTGWSGRLLGGKMPGIGRCGACTGSCSGDLDVAGSGRAAITRGPSTGRRCRPGPGPSLLRRCVTWAITCFFIRHRPSKVRRGRCPARRAVFNDAAAEEAMRIKGFPATTQARQRTTTRSMARSHSTVWTFRRRSSDLCPADWCVVRLSTSGGQGPGSRHRASGGGVLVEPMHASPSSSLGGRRRRAPWRRCRRRGAGRSVCAR